MGVVSEGVWPGRVGRFDVFVVVVEFEDMVWTIGRGGDELFSGGPEEVVAVKGRGSVKLGLGDGRLTSMLRRFVALGLGLLLLSCEIGDVKPLPLPKDSSEIGATMEIVSSDSFSSMSAVRISAALSRTVGTD